MSEQGKQAAKVVAMIAGGAVIGAGLGILFAPKAGVETRRDIGRYAKKAQVQASRWSRTVQSGVQDVMSRSKQLVQRREARPAIEAA
jgi:gas vesicle protein